MGKKHKSNVNLGRSLIKDRFGHGKDKKFVGDHSMLHTTEVNDGYDWGRLNLQSVTEESSFQEFLSTAELAGTEFQAEKLNIKFVNPNSNVGLLSKEEIIEAQKSHEKFRDILRIPRRPVWNSNTSAAELDENERQSFLEWRRNLSQLQEEHGCLLTPYEKNIEFWRQLWRVIEKSDVVVQIVDARNPLLFRCEDLENYVKEVNPNKINMVLLNKADFLTENQRKHWADYFTSINVNIAFYSAISEEEIQDSSDLKELENNLENVVIEELAFKNSSKMYSRSELIDLFRNLHRGEKVTQGINTIGLVGYPNVGKSSTINSLLMAKKVSVSATPGKTKHFQTLFLDKDILLCDCPGLVMPTFVFTKAEMIINGILPIDQMRDHVPPVNLVSSLIPRHVIEEKYSIMLPPAMEGEDPNRSPTAEELLNSYAYFRGFMTANGQPDNPRAARYILKDYINGKLLYCHAPPNVQQTDYHTWPERNTQEGKSRVVPAKASRAIRSNVVTSRDLDSVFFKSNTQGVHAKGVAGKSAGVPHQLLPRDESGNLLEKPWKKINKHINKNKKEKLRRVYAHLDQH